jgi:hypothetical protein
MQRIEVERDGGEGENADAGSACDCNLKDGSDDEPREMNHWAIMQVYLLRDFEMKEIFVVEIRVRAAQNRSIVSRSRSTRRPKGAERAQSPTILVGWLWVCVSGGWIQEFLVPKERNSESREVESREGGGLAGGRRFNEIPARSLLPGLNLFTGHRISMVSSSLVFPL